MENSTTIRNCSGERNCAYQQIIGPSSALQAVLRNAELVAPTDSTVLVLGETGTGKELIARSIHKGSPRGHRPFIKVNCAAIPFELLESELFGHERGAFTGAIAQKIGRFEMADTGTLFLDEIGDLPLAVQPKLLRVLQEREFERVGSGRTHRINVRLVAATHRDLGEMVRRGEFRSDLYYRLNVFPVTLPPLRERPEDIEPLVLHFVEVFSRRMSKRIDHVPEQVMAEFISYSWPGNVRELQNLIERAVILASKGVLPNPLSSASESPSVDIQPAYDFASSGSQAGTLRWRRNLLQIERAAVLEALVAAGWVVGGACGAAVRLGMKRTTLLARMKKLGISRPVIQSGSDEPVGARRPGKTTWHFQEMSA